MQPNIMMSWTNLKRPNQQNYNLKPIKKVKVNQSQENDPLFKTLSWRNDIKTYQLPEEGTYKIIEQQKIAGADQSKWGNNFQAIFININWNNTKFDQFEKIILEEDLLSNGIVFIWGPNEYLGRLFKIMAEKGIPYIENFTMVQLDRTKVNPSKIKKTKTLFNYFKSSKPTQQIKQEKDFETGAVNGVQQLFLKKDSDYLQHSHRTLYMFRKVQKKEPLELRHQRTSDAFFTIGNGDQIDFKSNQCVYKMIETLLIKANYKNNQPLKMLELYANQNQPRKGWVSVVQKRDNNKD